MGFRVLMVGGTGQVGSALVRAFLETSACLQVVRIDRRAITDANSDRLGKVVMDTASENFTKETAELAHTLMALGDPLYAASCIGVGKGSQRWSEADIRRLEIGVVGAFARGCRTAGVQRFGLLSAAGSNAGSRIRYVRIMGEKEDALRAIGFQTLTIFRPGIIAGNAHTPGYLATLGRLIPGPFGTIEQDDIARAFVGECLQDKPGTTILDNRAMRQRSRSLLGT